MERLLSSISRSFSFSISSSSSRRRPQSSIADCSSFSAERSSRGAATSEILRFEAEMAEKLLRLCSCVRRSAEKGFEVDLEWISEAIAVLMSAHSSAASVLPPAMVSAKMADRRKVQEYMDGTIGLLDVCNSLREASYGLDHHLASIVGAAGAFLSCSSSSTNSNNNSSANSSSPCSQTMKAAGRRLSACLAGLDFMEQRTESTSCSCTSSSSKKIMTMMMRMRKQKTNSKKKPQHIHSHSPCSSSSSSPLPSPRKRVVHTWQGKLQEAHTSLRLLQKQMKSKPLRLEQHIRRAGNDRLSVQAMVRALSAINEATVLVLEAAIAILVMRFGAGGLGKRKAWRRRRKSEGGWARDEADDDEFEDMAAAGAYAASPISENRRYLKGSGDNPWAEPLRRLRQILAGNATISAADKFSSLHSVLRLHLPSTTTSTSLTNSPPNHSHLRNHPSSPTSDSTVLIMSHVATLHRQAQKIRPSASAFHSMVGCLSDELTRVRIALLDATSSSTIFCPMDGDLYVDF